MNKKVLLGLISFLTILIVFFLIFFWFPSQYKNSVKVNTHKVNAFNSEKKVASVLVFSDLHLTYDYNVSDIDKLINTIQDINPDILIFNGDLFEANTFSKKDRSKEIALLQTKLKSLKILQGKFAILGEQDSKVKETKSILENSDFEILTNTSRNIKINQQAFNLIALNEESDLDKVFSKVNDKSFNFVVSHNPSRVEEISKYKVNLIVTGHTLGGEYNLPFYGSVYDDIRSLPYYKKVHNINDAKVYNSNGIGTSHSNMRFNAKSSIELFNLY